MKLFVLGILVCFFVQVSSAMQLISSLSGLMSQFLGGCISPARGRHFSGLTMGCRDKLLYLAEMIQAGDSVQTYKLVEEIFDDDEYWQSRDYTHIILNAAVRAENIRLLTKLLANTHIGDSSSCHCLKYAMIERSLPMVKFMCFHLYRRCCKYRHKAIVWDAEYAGKIVRKCKSAYERTTDEIRTYVVTFWDSVDCKNPEPGLLELEKMYAPRSLESHCERGLIEGLIKGADASFPDEFGETLLQKAIRLRNCDFERILSLTTEFRGAIFDLIQEIRVFNDNERLVAIDQENLDLVKTLLERCPFFLHSGFRNAAGNTVLHLAIVQSLYELVKEIVALNAGNRYGKHYLLNCKNAQGYTPLELAVGLGRFELVACFLSCAYLRTDGQIARELISHPPIASCLKG